MQTTIAATAPLARAVPPQPRSQPMQRVISQPFRPSGSNWGLADEYAATGLESRYVATWLEAQKQREREWLCWHMRNGQLLPPQPMPLPTAGTHSRPGSPVTVKAPARSEFEQRPSLWARFCRAIGCVGRGRRI